VALLWFSSCFLVPSSFGGQWNVLYLENMLRLAQDAEGEFIRNQMIMGVIDRLVEIDVSLVVFFNVFKPNCQKDLTSKVLNFHVFFGFLHYKLRT
jgi:hypothetical protein